ncbi:hypothetical protein CA13_11750 [Planctomycetes bacterium CA13]|uniref:Uncharacterized protein n=1 Tax=Novipirellula herctigrandis TaxID=2527986 RepID=A0A5C5YXH4_9BACT|nr:hypothetical protein CA13_11750 [Planctomycetes bacterium CA13]
MNRALKRYLGMLFWIAVAVGIAILLRPTPNSVGKTDAASVAGFVFGRSDRFTAVDTSQRLRRYDPVFTASSTGDWRQIGYVTSSDRSAGTVDVQWNDANLRANQARLFYYHNSGRLEDVLRIMFPPEKQRRIQDQLAMAFEAHGEEFSAAFVPLIQESIERSLPLIEDELRLSIDRHHAEVQKLAARWNDEVVGERLIPLAREEILPIVRRHAQPTVEKIGREVWDRASVWRFGWRAVYDKTPLPEQNLVQEEWRRFMENEAVPVVEAHVDEIVQSVQRVLAETASNPMVRAELADVANRIASDREAQALLQTVLKETLVGNERLHRVWSEVWQSNDARKAIDLAGQKMEPVIRRIGDELFGTREEGIDPMFALVLRNQIFGKDRRWVVAVPTDHSRNDGQQVVEVARDAMVYPIVYMAAGESQ